MRVAVVFEYPTVNGGENSVLAVLEWLIQHGPSEVAGGGKPPLPGPLPRGGEGTNETGTLEIVALCPPSGAVCERLSTLGIDIVTFDRHATSPLNTPPEAHAGSLSPLGRGSGRGASSQAPTATREQQIDALRTAVQRVAPDIVHANSLAMGRLLGAAAPQLTCPTTAHLRDILKLSKAAIRDLNQNSRLIAVSNATRNFHVGQGLTDERSVVIHNGVGIPAASDTRPDVRDRVRQQLCIPPAADVLLTVGQIGLRKGLDTLAKTATLLAERGRKFHWLIAGERFSQKQESIDFEKQVFATFANAEPNVTTHRLGYRNDVPDLMQAADLLVHGARQEPLGRVLLEAASLKLPIIATDVGGTREILEHEESGLIVPADDPDATAIAVEQLLDDCAKRQRIADAAFQRVAEHFSVEWSAVQLLELWQAAVDEKKSRPEA